MSIFPRQLEAETLGPIRFGYGHAPKAQVPAAAADIFASLEGKMPTRFAPRPFPQSVLARSQAVQMIRRGNKSKDAELREQGVALRRAENDTSFLEAGQALARIIASPSPFFERLTWHFINHFSLAPRNTRWHGAQLGFAEEAIRPHIMGYFGDMLRATTTHPAMLIYLDQSISMGPNSAQGKKRKKGLNENLARELLELHSMGVGYTQTDVRQLAELLTGMSFDDQFAFVFRSAWAEPGAEEVLQTRYGGKGEASLDDIETFLADIALRPETARNVSMRLAQHFIAEEPSSDLVNHMSAAWMSSGGYLPRVYEAMLEHGASWQDFGAKVKTPLEFIASSLVALGVQTEDLESASKGQVRKFMLQPLSAMGQPFMTPPTPEGWPEEADAWIPPQRLTERITWAMNAPFLQKMGGFRRPDYWAKAVLKDAARPELITALTRAPNKREGAGLLLASPDFQRR